MNPFKPPFSSVDFAWYLFLYNYFDKLRVLRISIFVIALKSLSNFLTFNTIFFIDFHIGQLCEIYLSWLLQYNSWWSYCMWFCWLFFDDLFTYRTRVDEILIELWSSNFLWQCSQNTSSKDISRVSFKFLDQVIW